MLELGGGAEAGLADAEGVGEGVEGAQRARGARHQDVDEVAELGEAEEEGRGGARSRVLASGVARKRITAVWLGEGAPPQAWQIVQVERVEWLEDGKTFPHEEPREKVARAINAGESFYVRGADGTEVPVAARLRHGKYYLTAPGGEADHLLALPVRAR